MLAGNDVPDYSLDRSVIAGLRELQEAGEPDIVAEVGGLFLKHSPRKLAAIKKAAEDGNAKALEAPAHGLKSSSLYIGATKLSEIASELELMGRQEMMEGALEKASAAEAEFEHVKLALEKEIKAGATEQRS